MDGKLKPGALKTFACPSCGGTVSLRAAGISITAVCQHCGAVIDVANEHLRVIATVEGKTRKLSLPIGTRGTLFGTEWEVIGFVSRTDDSEMYFWREYLLFNPYQGFRFLVENQGHWSFVRVLRDNIEGNGTANSLWRDYRRYRIFLRGGAKVEYVLGEFYWRVKIGERTSVADYISPPYMLSMEAGDDEINWSQGIYVDTQTMEDAFTDDLKKRFDKALWLPVQKGAAANQPSPVTGRIKSVMLTAIIFLAALIGFQIVAAGFADSTVVYNTMTRTTGLDKGREIASEPFTLAGNTGNVLVELASPVQNNWLEVGMSLVSETGNDSYNVLQGVEYYYGRDSDGAWSEGSQRSDTIISSVPGGTYRLLMEPDAGAYTSLASSYTDYSVKLKRNVLVWSNFWTAFFMIALYPLFMAARHWHFESKRWAESDLAPSLYGGNSQE